MHCFFFNKNLSPFLGMPPTNQKTLVKDLRIFTDDEKLVAFESFINVNFLDLLIISCLKLKPLKLLIDFKSLLFLSLSFSAIAKMNDKFC